MSSYPDPVTLSGIVPSQLIKFQIVAAIDWSRRVEDADWSRRVEDNDLEKTWTVAARLSLYLLR